MRSSEHLNHSYVTVVKSNKTLRPGDSQCRPARRAYTSTTRLTRRIRLESPIETRTSSIMRQQSGYI